MLSARKKSAGRLSFDGYHRTSLRAPRWCSPTDRSWHSLRGETPGAGRLSGLSRRVSRDDSLSSYITPRNAGGLITMAAPSRRLYVGASASASFDLFEGGMTLPGCLCPPLAAVETWSSTRCGGTGWSRRWLGGAGEARRQLASGGDSWHRYRVVRPVGGAGVFPVGLRFNARLVQGGGLEGTAAPYLERHLRNRALERRYCLLAAPRHASRQPPVRNLVPSGRGSSGGCDLDSVGNRLPLFATIQCEAR